MPDARRLRTAATVILLTVTAAIVYGIRLDHTPPHLHRDEAAFALQAVSMAETGRDTSGRRAPVYFEMRLLGEHVWFQPMLVYLTALFLRVLPLTQSVLRMPSVAIGTVDVVLMYLIATRLFGGQGWGVGAAVLLALTPAHVMHSRLAMDFIYPLPFVMGWLLCLLIYFERPRLPVLFAGASLLGIGFYSYIASVMMMPVYLLLTWLALFVTCTRSLRPYLVATAGFAWPLLCLAIWLPGHWSLVTDTLGRYHIGGTFGPTVVTDRISTYWRFFDPAFLFMIGGYTRMTNSTRLVGVFLLPLLIFVPLGILQIASARRTPIGLIVVLGFLLAPLAASIAVPEEPYASDRALAVVPFGVLVAMFGIERLLSMGTRGSRALLAGLLVLVPIHFLVFEFHYFGDYHRRSAFWFEWDHLGALEAIIARTAYDNRPIVLSNGNDKMMEAYWRLALAAHHREDLLQRTVYIDASRVALADLPPRALILINRHNPEMTALAASGQLHQVAEIPEPGDVPYYFVVER